MKEGRGGQPRGDTTEGKETRGTSEGEPSRKRAREGKGQKGGGE